MTEGIPRWFCALCDAPNSLAAESVYASRAAPSLSMEQAISMPSSAKVANEAGREQARFLSGGHTGNLMGMRAQIRAQSGARKT